MDQIQTVTGGEAPADSEAEVWDLEAAEVPDAEQVDTAEMGELPVEDWDYQRPRRGQVRAGVILAIEEQEIIVDVGVKRDGIVPFADMQRMGPEALAELSVGDEVPVFILRPEDRDGNLLVSLYLARQEQAWQRAAELADSGEVWAGQIVGYNKGGVVIPLGEIRGFVPASQVPGFPRGLSQEERLDRLSELVGQELMVKVIEINRRKRRLILSASAAQREWRKQQRERLLEDLREGEVRRGHVSSLCSFGAFVDLGGADGLIHLSELSWRRVRHPREVVSRGDEVDVYVLRLDRERKRIGLSLKRLLPEPWAVVEERYELGQLIEGIVTNVTDFGAFAEIEEGVEGLIHISELTDSKISDPREVVKRGDLLLLRIIRIDARRKRLGLSLKRVLESEWAEWAARLAVEDASELEAAEEESRPLEEPATVEPAQAEVAVVAEPPEAEGLEELAMVKSEEFEEVDEPEATEVGAEEEPPVLMVEEPEGLAEAEEPEATEVEAEEEPPVLMVEEPEELAEAEEPEATEVEAEEEPSVLMVEEPEGLAEAEEPEATEVEAEEEPLVLMVEEPEGLAEVEEPEATVVEAEEEQSVLTVEEPEELAEAEGAEEPELIETESEESDEVQESSDLPDAGVEETEVVEISTVEDSELAAVEA